MPRQQKSQKRKQPSLLRRHSLGLAASGILLLWIVLYNFSDERTHLGSFFGNAVADWSGLVVMVFATKSLYEKGSAESRSPKPEFLPKRLEWMHEHSLSLFLVATGLLWIALFAHVDSESKWGQVVGNIVSEWIQILGVVLLTKHLIESHSKESKNNDK